MFKKGYTNKNVFSDLIKELIILAEMEGTQSTCLNIIENMPVEIQLKIIRNLAKTNNPKLISLFQMLARETEGETQNIAEKALRKYQYLGYEIKSCVPPEIESQDIQAFISPTRLEGACVLVFFHAIKDKYHAHYFSLAFNHLGIKEYFQYSSNHKEDLLSIANKQSLKSINYQSAQRLLQDAYRQNKRFGTKAASGFSQYKYFLKLEEEEDKTGIELTGLIEKNLKPEQIINIYFLALKNMDSALIYDLATSELQKKFGERDNFIANWVHPFEKYTFIKSVPLEWEGDQRKYRRKYQLIAGNEKDELQKISFIFSLEKGGGQWFFSEVKIECFSPITEQDPLNPLNYQVYASAYKINNSTSMKNIFDNWEHVNITGEFSGGNCYKWFKAGNIIDIGIDVSRDIYGEFILTNEELIIFSNQLKNLTEVSYHLQQHVLDKNDIELQLIAKGPSRVREIYQVITDKEFSLSTYLATKHKINHLNISSDYEYWISLFKERAEEFYLLGSKIQVFCLKEDKLEVLFYEDHGFIFNYDESSKKIQEKIPTLIGKTRELNLNWEYLDEKGKWQYYKLINSLEKDPFTRVFVPPKSKWALAKKMQIVK